MGPFLIVSASALAFSAWPHPPRLRAAAAHPLIRMVDGAPREAPPPPGAESDDASIAFAAGQAAVYTASSAETPATVADAKGKDKPKDYAVVIGSRPLGIVLALNPGGRGTFVSEILGEGSVAFANEGARTKIEPGDYLCGVQSRGDVTPVVWQKVDTVLDVIADLPLPITLRMRRGGPEPWSLESDGSGLSVEEMVQTASTQYSRLLDDAQEQALRSAFAEIKEGEQRAAREQAVAGGFESETLKTVSALQYELRSFASGARDALETLATSVFNRALLDSRLAVQVRHLPRSAAICRQSPADPDHLLLSTLLPWPSLTLASPRALSCRRPSTCFAAPSLTQVGSSPTRPPSLLLTPSHTFSRLLIPSHSGRILSYASTAVGALAAAPGRTPSAPAGGAAPFERMLGRITTTRSLSGAGGEGQRLMAAGSADETLTAEEADRAAAERQAAMRAEAAELLKEAVGAVETWAREAAADDAQQQQQQAADGGGGDGSGAASRAAAAPPPRDAAEVVEPDWELFTQRASLLGGDIGASVRMGLDSARRDFSAFQTLQQQGQVPTLIEQLAEPEIIEGTSVGSGGGGGVVVGGGGGGGGARRGERLGSFRDQNSPAAQKAARAKRQQSEMEAKQLKLAAAIGERASKVIAPTAFCRPPPCLTNEWHRLSCEFRIAPTPSYTACCPAPRRSGEWQHDASPIRWPTPSNRCSRP